LSVNSNTIKPPQLVGFQHGLRFCVEAPTQSTLSSSLCLWLPMLLIVSCHTSAVLGPPHTTSQPQSNIHNTFTPVFSGPYIWLTLSGTQHRHFSAQHSPSTYHLQVWLGYLFPSCTSATLVFVYRLITMSTQSICPQPYTSVPKLIQGLSADLHLSQPLHSSTTWHSAHSRQSLHLTQPHAHIYLN